MRFTDLPQNGPGGDQLVETFYQIAPQQGNLDPQYSELDFEYLPNGGWGQSGATLFVTSWETFQLEPWQAFNVSEQIVGSLDGWHTLVLTVADGEVKYYLDGRLIGKHGGKNYPNVPMALNYNLWFINGGLAPASETRTYNEWIDWTYYQLGAVLTPQEVEQRIQVLRGAGVSFNDTVPAHDPPLDSPCNF